MNDIASIFPYNLRQLDLNYYNYLYSKDITTRIEINLDERKTIINDNTRNELYVTYSRPYAVYETLSYFLFVEDGLVRFYYNKPKNEIVSIDIPYLISVYYEFNGNLINNLKFSSYYKSNNNVNVVIIVTEEKNDVLYANYNNQWYNIYKNLNIGYSESYIANSKDVVYYNYNNFIIYVDNIIYVRLDDVDFSKLEPVKN